MAYSQLQSAFSPDLLFQRSRPGLLYPRHLDGNTVEPLVYARVPQGTEPEHWTRCDGR